MRGLQCDLYTTNYNILSKDYSHIFFVLFMSIMLGLNFHIFWMRFATHLDIKLFLEKTEKDFQRRVIKKTAPRNILLGAGGG